MLGPFATVSRFTLSFTRGRYCRHCRTPPAHRCPRRRQRQRQRVTEGDRYGPMEWAQRIQCNLLVVCIKIHTVCTTMTCLPAAAAAAVPGPRRSADDDGSHCSTCWSRGPVTSCPLSDAASWWRHCRCSCLYRETDPTINIIPSN